MHLGWIQDFSEGGGGEILEFPPVFWEGILNIFINIFINFFSLLSLIWEAESIRTSDIHGYVILMGYDLKPMIMHAI